MLTKEVKIVFENEDFMCLDKPAGLVVHSDGRTEEKSLTDWVKKYSDTNGLNLEVVGNPHTLDSGRYVERWGIVNRLDRDTSGLILIAKNQDTFTELRRLFQEKKMVKKYEALVWGDVDIGEKTETTINEKVTRHKKDPRVWTCGFTSEEGGRQTGLDAITFVEKVRYISEKNWTLLSLTPKTGRTHQLRLHCRFLGHPIVGDDKYGLNGKVNQHSTRQIVSLLVEENIKSDMAETLKLVAKGLEFELYGQKYNFKSYFNL